MKTARGFTLIELLIAIAIMGILLSIATVNWNQLQVKSNVESQIKKIHADLMEVRLQALYSKTARSVVIDGVQYRAYATTDTSAAPVATKQYKYPVRTLVITNPVTLTFDAQGLMNGAETSVCILPTDDTTVVNQAAVDSIVVSQARINIGKRNGGDCKSANIDQK